MWINIPYMDGMGTTDHHQHPLRLRLGLTSFAYRYEGLRRSDFDEAADGKDSGSGPGKYIHPWEPTTPHFLGL